MKLSLSLPLPATLIACYPCRLCQPPTPRKPRTNRWPRSRSPTAWSCRCGPVSRCWSIRPAWTSITRGGCGWCESVNYRCKLRNQPLRRPEGDRILILEDTKGTGKADKVTVFYQAPEILAPLGIAVLPHHDGPGCTVYVCQSPDILVFEDKDGDGKADGPPRKLLTGFKRLRPRSRRARHPHRARRQALFHGRRHRRAKPGRQVRQEVDQQRHRLPGRDHLALRSRRQEPRTDRPQLPQPLRAVRRQLRHRVRLRQRRRRQPADAHLLRHARRQLRLPSQSKGLALERGDAGHRAENPADLLRLADRHLLLRGHAAAGEVSAAICCTPTPGRGMCAPIA